MSKTRDTESYPVIEKLKKQADMFSNVMSEIKNQYREITVGDIPNDRTIRIRFPNLEAEERINKVYSKEYGKMISDPDLKTEDELLSIMEERGVWTKDHDAKLKAIRERVAYLSRLLIDNDDTLTSKEKKEVCTKYEDAYKELEDLSERRNSVINNSVEARATEVKTKIQITECSFYLNGDKEERVWKSLDEINNETKRLLLNRVINEAISFWNGVPSNFLDASPVAATGEKDIPSPKKQDKPSLVSP